MHESIQYRNLPPPNQLGSDREHVVVTSDWINLRQILEPDVLAVILTGSQRPAWIGELASVVRSSQFVVPRMILADATADEIADSLASRFFDSPLSSEAQQGLREDMESLVRRCSDLTGSKRFRFRFFTDKPNCRCSYHVDTVPPGVPTTALIRVYCGAPTEYVMPSNLTCWEDFYSYIFQRSQQAKAIAKAREVSDLASEMLAQARLNKLDERPLFLIRPDIPPQTVSPNALVACKFVDSHYLWGGAYLHARSAHGWIHRSPMAGEPRFVASVNAVG
jgi:Protein of unknown function (DUF1826)